jgi:hypothetical protein
MGKEGVMHHDFLNREGLEKSLLRVTECGHEEKTQIGILYSLALSGFGVLLCQGLQSRKTQHAGSAEPRRVKGHHTCLVCGHNPRSQGGEKGRTSLP